MRMAGQNVLGFFFTLLFSQAHKGQLNYNHNLHPNTIEINLYLWVLQFQKIQHLNEVKLHH